MNEEDILGGYPHGAWQHFGFCVHCFIGFFLGLILILPFLILTWVAHQLLPPIHGRRDSLLDPHDEGSQNP